MRPAAQLLLFVWALALGAIVAVEFKRVVMPVMGRSSGAPPEIAVVPARKAPAEIVPETPVDPVPPTATVASPPPSPPVVATATVAPLPDVAILLPGHHAGHVTPLVGNEIVFGLYDTSSTTSALREQKTIVSRFVSTLDTAGQKTGKDVAIEGDQKALMWFYGPFKKGAIKRATTSEESWPSPFQLGAEEFSVSLGQKSYTFTLQSQQEIAVDAGRARTQFVYSISDGVNAQTIELLGAIVWMGDVDRDGKLDLLVDDNFSKCLTGSYRLLLSAKAPKLFRRAATFLHGRCA